MENTNILISLFIITQIKSEYVKKNRPKPPSGAVFDLEMLRFYLSKMIEGLSKY